MKSNSCFAVPLLLCYFIWICVSKETTQRPEKRFDIRGKEWVAAQKIINKLVDESIANRVSEAEHDVERLLESNIADHIKKTGKTLLRKLPKECTDKIEHCSALAKSGVCKTSPKAMHQHCAKTCNLCEPLLSQQSKGVMKFHENDLSPENEKIRDAQKLLEYVKVLNPPKKMAILEAKVSLANEKKKSTTKKPKKIVTHEDKDKEQEDREQKDEVKKEEKSKPNHAPKSKVAKKKLKVKGTPLTSLSKTVTYKNHKYKITPVVDWERISKMLESLGYKAVHIVGVKDKSIHKDLTEHLKKHGVDNILSHKIKGKAAAETFVSAVHREKSWHNDEYFKTHCHPKCLTSCVSSCMPGCCREHDKVSVKTGLAKHCHASCLTNCLPSCGSGCCSADEERKRGHHFLHYQRIKDYHKTKDEAASKQHDQPKKDTKKLEDKVNPKCHPQCKETCISSCGKGCCTDEGERLRDENERKMKDQQEKYRKEKQKKILEMYKPQPRLCPAPCPQVCAPACADDCCAFGKYASPPAPGLPASDQPHPGLTPNVPYPHSKVIPLEAYACKETCKFSCTYDCPRDCCQPEELAQEEAHEAAALAPSALSSPAIGSPTTIGAPQAMAYQDLAPAMGTCPSPCPGGCYPSCTVACCTSALGLPQENQAELSPEARSSTKRVLHITHLVRPITSLNGCALSCATHCTPACARSGCCDSSKRKKRSD
ncbi:uncharacterized protein [Pocillopora verrucosa]|uniref:uncharacterized protein isoform X2 n=1 Tax=Pocillopora verrucosa TaxID=203993 RepID=UPI00333EFBF5